MDRIHSSMDKMVEAQRRRSRSGQGARREARGGRWLEMKGMADSVSESSQQEAASSRAASAPTTDESLQSLRRTHEDQSNRLQRVVQENATAGTARCSSASASSCSVIGAMIVLQLAS